MRMLLSDSRLSNMGASLIVDGFDEYLTRFKMLTRRAPERFENRDWRGMQSDAVSRLRLYSVVIDGVVDSIHQLAGVRSTDPTLWPAIKAVYSV